MVRCLFYALFTAVLLMTGMPALQAQEPIEMVRKALVDALPKWEIVQCDEQPSVRVDIQAGSRIVFRISERIMVDPGPQQITPGASETYRIDYQYIDIILMPSAAAAILPEKIPWNDYPHRYFTRAFDMGTGLGYRWYGRMTIYYQEILREKLGLTDGDDRIKLLVEGLAIKDEGTWTTNSCMPLLAGYGERAIPDLEKALEQQENPWNQVMTLGKIPGEKATKILQRLYGLDKPTVIPNQRNAAEYALVYPYHRKEAKQEYLDMLRRQRYVGAVAKICVEFGWTDAAPHLTRICDKPATWDNYKAAFIARRALEGKPAPPMVLQELRSQVSTLALSTHDQPDAATLEGIRQTALAIEDKEAVAVFAVDLATFSTKAQREQIRGVQSLGRELLHQLPPEITKPLLDSVHAITDENFQRELGAL